MNDQRFFFFKRALSINPLIVPVTHLTQGTPVVVDKAALSAAGVTCFKFVNPSPYWVWMRGVTADGGGNVKEMGHYLGPGAIDICSTQLPDYVAAVAQAEPGVPAAANGAGLLDVPARVILIYGSGNA